MFVDMDWITDMWVSSVGRNTIRKCSVKYMNIKAGDAVRLHLKAHPDEPSYMTEILTVKSVIKCDGESAIRAFGFNNHCFAEHEEIDQHDIDSLLQGMYEIYGDLSEDFIVVTFV